MPLTRSTLERTAATESYALLRSGRRGYQVRGDRGLAPLMRVELDPLYRRARFPGYRVRRRSLASSDLWLVHEEDGPVAVALKESWPLGLRYRVEWTGGELVLVGSRTTYLWELFDQEDEVVGDLRTEPFTDGERRLSLPADVPHEVACFLVALTEIVLHNPVLRLLDRATRPQHWS